MRPWGFSHLPLPMLYRERRHRPYVNRAPIPPLPQPHSALDELDAALLERFLDRGEILGAKAWHADLVVLDQDQRHDRRFRKLRTRKGKESTRSAELSGGHCSVTGERAQQRFRGDLGRARVSQLGMGVSKGLDGLAALR